MSTIENTAAIAATTTKRKHRPSVLYLRSILTLDREAGVLRWKAARGPVRAGDIAGHVGKDGQVYVTIGGQQHDAALVAFLLVRDALAHRGRGHVWRSAKKAAVGSDNLTTTEAGA